MDDAEHDARLNRLIAALAGIASVEPVFDEDEGAAMSSPCIYCWKSGPLNGPPEVRHTSDCEWIEAREALASS